MANIIYYANIIENKPFGKDVQGAIIEGLKELDNYKTNGLENAITSGEVYDLLNSLRIVNEVAY